MKQALKRNAVVALRVQMQYCNLQSSNMGFLWHVFLANP